MKTRLLYLILIIQSIAFAQIPNDDISRYLFTNGSLVNEANIGTGDLIQTGTSSILIDGIAANVNNAIKINSDTFESTAVNTGSVSTEFSYSFWFKLSGSATNEKEIIRFTNQNGNRIRFTQETFSNGSVDFLWRIENSAGNGTGRLATEPGLNDGNWHNIVMTSALNFNTELRVYLDGTFSGNLTFNGSNNPFLVAPTNYSSHAVTISQGTNGFANDIDNVRVYDRTLSQAEITALSNENAPTLVNIPDVNLKAALVGNNIINTNGDTEIQVAEAAAFTGIINVPNMNITDGTGLEAFRNMSGLNLTNNRLTTFNLPGNYPNLISINYLFFTSPASTLSSVNIGNAPQLEDINFINHDIITFTMPNTNTSVITLSLAFNELTTPIDVSFMTDLEFLSLNNNNIPSVDVTTNTNLKTLTLVDLPITTLDLTNNSLLEVLNLNATGISTLDVTQMSNLLFLSVNSASSITSLDITNNTSLITLYTLGSGLTTLDITNNLLLENLGYGGSLISTVDFSNNSLIESFFYTDSFPLTNDFSTLPALIYIEIQNTSVTSLDFSQNTNIEEFYIYDTPSLSTINIANGNNTNIFDFEADNAPSLTCVQVDDVTYSTNNWFVPSQTNFSTNCALGINDFELQTLKLYPNPTSNFLNIEIDSDLEQATIYSILGAEIFKSTSKSINVSNLKSGVYLIKIEDENGNISTKRFIKK